MVVLWGFVSLTVAATPGEKQASSPPPDLRTRKTGSDWPKFLGPTGDSVSPEKGLITPWPAKGPRVLWEEKKLGTGYGPPAVSRGRLFVFDRHGLYARLSCLKSETGEELWKFEYPTDYKDKYGYNNGPHGSWAGGGRGPRLPFLVPRAMLHCVRRRTARWSGSWTRRRSSESCRISSASPVRR